MRNLLARVRAALLPFSVAVSAQTPTHGVHLPTSKTLTVPVPGFVATLRIYGLGALLLGLTGLALGDPERNTLGYAAALIICTYYARLEPTAAKRPSKPFLLHRHTRCYMTDVVTGMRCTWNSQQEKHGIRMCVCLCSLIFMSPSSLHADDETARIDRVKFGINGHPLVAGAYSEPLEVQIAQLKSLGLGAYRVNVNPANMTPAKSERLAQLVNLAHQQDIEILVTIVIKAQEYSRERDAYDAAKSATYTLTQQIGKQIRAWELGNEYDLYCVKEGASGRVPADYDTEKYTIVRGLVQGMLAGLRDGSPTALRIVQTSQNRKNPDSGFLQRLIHDGIEFDITGYHYYSHDGHIRIAENGKSALQILRDEFHKPIWITEFDQASHDGVGPNANPGEQAKALDFALRAIARDARQYDVEQAYIYELLDQPELLTTKPVQAQFGILHSDGSPTDASVAVKRFLQSHY